MSKLREITSIEEWQELLKASQVRDLFVFKHSTRCPISAAAWAAYQAYLADDPKDGADHAWVKVIESRPVSNRIAQDLQVQHESPQAILVRGGRAVWNESHRAITKERLTEVLVRQA